MGNHAGRICGKGGEIAGDDVAQEFDRIETV